MENEAFATCYNYDAILGRLDNTWVHTGYMMHFGAQILNLSCSVTNGHECFVIYK